MKANLHAAMVIGYEIPASEAIQEKEVRGCKHAEIEGANFCPECGARMFEYQDRPIFEDRQMFGGLEGVIVPTSKGSDDEHMRYFLGHACDTRWSIKELSVYNFDQHRAALRKKLEELGVDWKQCNFGLHLAAGLSY
jgi:hypothetical protein